MLAFCVHIVFVLSFYKSTEFGYTFFSFIVRVIAIEGVRTATNLCYSKLFYIVYKVDSFKVPHIILLLLIFSH